MQSNMVPLSAPPGDGTGVGAGTVVVQMPEHPDYVVWSIATLFYGNPCCLGLLAFYYSVKSRDRKMIGDVNGAKSYAASACRINGCALALILVFIIIIVVMVTQGSRVGHGTYSRGY